MDSPIFGFDIDGVICNFEKEFCERFGYANRHLVSLSARYPEVDKDIINEFASNPDNYRDLEPIFGGILLLRESRKRGFDTVLVTSRPNTPKFRDITEEWLQIYGIPYDQLIFSSDKATTIKNFGNGGLEHGFVFFVDDIAKNLENFPEGVTGLCWRQPWNMGTFPAVMYDEDFMKVMLQVEFTNRWTPFWSNE